MLIRNHWTPPRKWAGEGQSTGQRKTQISTAIPTPGTVTSLPPPDRLWTKGPKPPTHPTTLTGIDPSPPWHHTYVAGHVGVVGLANPRPLRERHARTAHMKVGRRRWGSVGAYLYRAHQWSRSFYHQFFFFSSKGYLFKASKFEQLYLTRHVTLTFFVFITLH